MGLPYGIANSTGIIPDDQILDIFDTASLAGINLIDTAIAYGRAEEKIGLFAGNKFDIVTKLPANFKDEINPINNLSNLVNESLERLKTDKIYGLLLHRPHQLDEKGGLQIIEILNKLKIEGKVEKIGVSIYRPIELELLVGQFDIDIVQCPLNIFDRSLITSGWLSRLSRKGIEVHVRSIFLQGLLLLPPEQRHYKFNKWNTLFSEYDNWLKETGYSSLEACLKFALSFTEIRNVIIGVDNASQLKEIIESSKGHFSNIPDTIISNDLKLINPLSWLDF